jgi:hypothetical protein
LQRIDDYFPAVDKREVLLVRGWKDFVRIASERPGFRKIERESKPAVFFRVMTAMVAVLMPPLVRRVRSRPHKDEDKLDYIKGLWPLLEPVSNRHSDAMSAYRGRFVANYLLGLGAVAAALIALVLIKCAGGVSDYGLLVVLVYVAMLKWLIVDAVSVGTHRAKHARVSRTAVGLRYQIERYRAMEPLFLAGSAAMRLPRPSARRGQQVDIAEDVMRLVPLAELSGTHSKNRVVVRLRRLVWTQLLYHSRKHKEMHAVQNRLERTVDICGKAILWILGIDIAVIAIKMLLKDLSASMPAGLLGVGDALSVVGFLLVLATAFLPALMATLNALLFQSAAEQLSERHRAMANTLRALYKEVLRIHEKIRGGDASPMINQDILDLSEKTAEAMAEEVAEWAALYLQSVKDA